MSYYKTYFLQQNNRGPHFLTIFLLTMLQADKIPMPAIILQSKKNMLLIYSNLLSMELFFTHQIVFCKNELKNFFVNWYGNYFICHLKRLSNWNIYHSLYWTFKFEVPTNLSSFCRQVVPTIQVSCNLKINRIPTKNKIHECHNSSVTTCIFSFFQCLHCRLCRKHVKAHFLLIKLYVNTLPYFWSGFPHY